MSFLLPTPGYVCRRCTQNLSRRQFERSVRPQCRFKSLPSLSSVRSRRMRKVWIVPEEVIEKTKKDILVGKNPRKVPIGPAVKRIIKDFQDVPTPERPAGRIRAGRVRIPARRNERERGLPAALEPSAPSAPLGSSKKALEPKAAEPRAAPTRPTSTGRFIRPDVDFNWYWETFAPTLHERQRANEFFLRNQNPPRLLSSAARFKQVPDSDVPEVAFVGRSNVGKSSLLNGIVDANIKDLLARTSATRGFTKTMNFYGIGPGLGINLSKAEKGRQRIEGKGVVIVDMPGYGEGSLQSWGVEIMKYIQSRKQLRRVFVLLDAEHGIKDKDRSLLASLRLAGVSHQVVLSKMDKLYIPEAKDIKHFNNKKSYQLKPKGTVEVLRKEMQKLKPDLKPPVGGGALGEVLACSSEILVDGRRLGVDHVRYAILKAVGLERSTKKSREMRGEPEAESKP